MLQRVKPAFASSLILGTIAIFCVIVSHTQKAENSALLLSYHLLILFLLPLLVLLWSHSPKSLWVGLILGEIPLFWGSSFSLSALFFLLSLTLFLQAIFAGIQKKKSLLTAQTLIPFLFYLTIFPLFISNEILYALPSESRSGVIQGMIFSNPLFLLVGSILEQKEFFRFYYMYNLLSDIGSYYPHRFPSKEWVLGLSSIFALLSFGTLFYLEKKTPTEKNPKK
ncbi:MAG: hypothetical protein AABZ60_22960 [Planctomycetota bacterium]